MHDFECTVLEIIFYIWHCEANCRCTLYRMRCISFTLSPNGEVTWSMSARYRINSLNVDRCKALGVTLPASYTNAVRYVLSQQTI